MHIFDFLPCRCVRFSVFIAQAQKLFKQVLLKVNEKGVKTFDCLSFESSTVEPDDSKVVPVLDLPLYLPVGLLQLFILQMVSIVGNLSLVYHFHEMVIFHRFSVFKCQHGIEIFLFILHLGVHLVLEQHAFKVEDHILKLIPDELDEGTQVDQLCVHLIDDICHNVLDLFA